LLAARVWVSLPMAAGDVRGFHCGVTVVWASLASEKK